MNFNWASLSSVRFFVENMPASATMTMSAMLWRSWNCFTLQFDGVSFGLVSFKAPDFSREPVAIY